MRTCGICGEKVASYICRRCNRWVCTGCYFHHGLCKECAESLGRKCRGKICE